MKRVSSFVRGFIFCWTVMVTVGFYQSEKERKELLSSNKNRHPNYRSYYKMHETND